MRPTLRPPFLLLLLPVLVALLASGCSGGSAADDDGPTVVATGPHDSPSPSTSAPTSAATTSATGSTPARAPSSSATTLGPELAAVCAPYSVMVEAIEDAAQHSSDPEEIAAAIAPVMKRFAERVPALQRPPGMSAETWAGVVALAEQIRALPAHPSSDDIDAVEQQLSPDQRAAVEDAAAWFKSSCGL